MRVRVIQCCLLMLVLLLSAAPSLAQSPAPSEYELKAAFLYNFAKYVDWPAQAFTNNNSPFVIGVLGDNPFGNALDQVVAGKKIGEHPIVIQAYRSVAEATNCHILFVSSSEEKRLPEIIQTVRDKAMLTVSETDRFTEAGGIIKFLQEGTKIRFQINDDAAKGARLKVSAKLLNLAVRPPPLKAYHFFWNPTESGTELASAH